MKETYDHTKINHELVDVYKDTLLKATQYTHGCTTIYNQKSMIYIKNKGLTGNIKVQPIDTIGMLETFKNDEKKSCVLNMASAKRPGGGVSRGAKAQEEGLFRCSNLALSISPEFYPMKSYDTLYTTNVTFFKNFSYIDMKPIVCDVITIAAFNLNKEKIIHYKELTYDKINFMLRLAAMHDVHNLILGAWGCGVYKNDPHFIATAFKESLAEDDMAHNFENIIFAVINDHNSVGNNFNIFKSIFESC